MRRCVCVRACVCVSALARGRAAFNYHPGIAIKPSSLLTSPLPPELVEKLSGNQLKFSLSLVMVYMHKNVSYNKCLLLLLHFELSN